MPVLADLGIPLGLLRGVVLLARCAGLLGHLAEEVRSPVAGAVFADADVARGPPAPAGPPA